MRWAKPDHVARSVHTVDYEGLVEQGVQAILYDLENTLCRWRAWELDERTWALLRRLAHAGLRLAVLTNAPLSPDHPLAEGLEEEGIAVVSSARKPLRRGFRIALDRLGVRPDRAAIVGDQVLTDVLGGRWAGLTTVLVDPVGPEESRPTKLNRLVERLAGRRVLAREGSGRP